MINLESLSPTMLLARGQYATVRSAHEDAKKELSVLCGKMGGAAAQILRKMQPDNDSTPPSAEIADLLTACRWTIDEIEKTTARIESLSQQRASIKPIAWPK